MHQLLGQDITAKHSGVITLPNFSGTIQYVAAPLIEKFVVRDANQDEVGIIYTKQVLDKVLNIQVDKTVYTGEVTDFLWLATLDEDTLGEDTLHIEWDAKPKGSQTKPSKREWIEFNAESNNFVEEGMIEDYLYQTPTYEQVARTKDLEWLKNKNYHVLITKEETDAYIEFLHTLPKDTLLSIDTETTGLKADHLKTDKIVGISLSHEIDTGYYIPLMQKHGKNNYYGTEQMIELLRPLIALDEPDTHLHLIGQNLGFDWKVFKMYGVELNIVHDTYVMLALINWSKGKQFKYEDFVKHYKKFGYTESVLYDVYHAKTIKEGKDVPRSNTPADKLPELSTIRPLGLKGSVEHYFNQSVLELGEMFEKRTKADMERMRELALGGANMDEITKSKLLISDTFSEMMDFRYAPEWFYTLYGPADGDFPLMIYKELTKPGGDWDQYNGSLDFTYQLEVMAIPSFSEQEFYGIRFESEGVKHLEEEAIIKRDELEQQIYDMVGYEFNIGSSLQLGKVLFEDMGCPPLDRFKNRKSGNWKTDKDTLKMLGNYTNDDGSQKYPIVGLLNEHSAISHAITSFYSNLPKLERGGYLFPQYSQLGAATGRVTCRNPNVQQMYPKVRTYVVPDSSDYYFAICDFSQIERRVMGGLSKDDGIRLRFIEDPEADSHIQTYAQMTGTPYEEVTPSQRKIGKTLNFATAYGVGDQQLAKLIYGKDDQHHQTLAADMKKQYFDSVPVFNAYLEGQRDTSEKTGFAETYFGRQRYIKEFNYEGEIRQHTRESGRRAAGNMVVQGTAADILKLALVRLRHAFRSYGYYEDMASVRMNVHDEVTYQLHKSIHPYIACKIMKEAMEIDLSGDGFPPFYAGMNVGYNWKDGKRDDLEAQVLHMKYMMELATDHLNNGTPLPPYDPDNIMQFWLDDIRRFSVEQIVQELQKGFPRGGGYLPITNLSEAYTNPRISKYSSYFGETAITIDPNILVMECHFAKDSQAILDDWSNIEQAKGKYLTQAINYLNTQRPTHVTTDNQDYISFFGQGYPEVLKALQDTQRAIESIQMKGNTTLVIFSDGLEVATLNAKDKDFHERPYPVVFIEGQELESEPIMVDELIMRDLDIIGETYVFSNPDVDADLLKYLQDMLVPTDMIAQIDTNRDELKKVSIQLRGGTNLVLDGYLIEQCQPLFIEYLVAFYCGESYEPIHQELQQVIESSWSKQTA